MSFLKRLGGLSPLPLKRLLETIVWASESCGVNGVGVAIRTNHYDVAFEAYLRATGRPYVAIDETRRALLDEVSLKSMDFIVDGGPHRLLLDVKGRRFPTGGATGTRWECWADQDDIASLLRWEDVFGSRYRAALVFAYHITEPQWYDLHPVRWEFSGRVYAFYAVWVRDYARAMRTRSPKWQTVSLRKPDYAQLRTPWEELLRL